MASADYSHHFSFHNVPFGIASSKSHSRPQAVTRLGNSVVFLHDCHAGGLFDGIEGLPLNVFSHDTLNEFAALPKPIQQQIRKAIQDSCHDGTIDVSKLPQGSVADISQVQMHMPVRVGDFAGSIPLCPPWPAFPLTPPRLFLLPRARQKRRPHHHQRRTAASGLFQLPHRLPGTCQLRRRVRDRHRAAAGPVPRQVGSHQPQARDLRPVQGRRLRAGVCCHRGKAAANAATAKRGGR